MQLTKALKKQVLDEAGWKCEYCGTELNELTASVDHKIPLSKGGTTDRSNLIAACSRCNMQKADKIISTISSPIAKQAAEAWIHAYIKSPRLTGTFSVVVGIISVVVSFYANQFSVEIRQAELSKNLDFRAQIQHLNQTESNIRQLLEFVEFQKTQLTNNEQSISLLKEEQQKLKPLVSANKQVVEAIFATQEAKARESAIMERWIGFGLGVVASIVASVILFIVQYFIRAARKNS